MQEVQGASQSKGLSAWLMGPQTSTDEGHGAELVLLQAQPRQLEAAILLQYTPKLPLASLP